MKKIKVLAVVLSSTISKEKGFDSKHMNIDNNSQQKYVFFKFIVQITSNFG